MSIAALKYRKQLEHVYTVSSVGCMHTKMIKSRGKEWNSGTIHGSLLTKRALAPRPPSVPSSRTVSVPRIPYLLNYVAQNHLVQPFFTILF